ncbi:MAG: molecular chaperone [Anaerolineaceae bacterium]|nr:molecular chaperone [Anaerolineaceae bacterium]
MRLGIDFGTTNSGIAFYDGQRLFAVRTNPENENPDVLPSLIYIDREYNATVGIEAAFAYLEHDTGRPVKWQRQHVGEVEIVVAGKGDDAITYGQEMHVLVDVAAHGRLLQSVKTILRSPTYDGTRIFDRFYTVDELIRLLLEALKNCAEAQFGEVCDAVVIGRPVKFSDDPTTDARAEEIIYTAAWRAGFRNITFATEPLAVTYLHHVNSPERNTSLVIDFGGGTLDLTVAKVGGSEKPEILANRGVLVGGDDLDKAIMKYLTKYFGRGAIVGHDQPFPDDMLDLLQSWQTMSDLSRPQHIDRIKQFQQKSNNRQAMRALETLVTQNLGYQLFRTIERTKRDLSSALLAKLDFEHGNIKIHEVITRTRFEQLIARELTEVEAAVHAVVADAGLTPDDIDVVLRTGGSSAVPAFVNMLGRIFGADKLRQLEALVSVVGGMAVISHDNQRPIPTYSMRYETETHHILDNICVESDQHAEKYYLGVSQKAYVDSAWEISYLPANLSGLPSVRIPALDLENDTEDYLRFDIHVPSRVYVGYDGNALERPRWLRDWQRDDTALEIADGWRAPRVMKLYSKVFEPGTVVLGGNKARGYAGDIPTNYLVIVKAMI